MIITVAAVTGASLAIGAGFALDRVVLPELGTEPASAHGAAPRPDSASTSPLPEDRAPSNAAPSARPTSAPSAGGGLGDPRLPLKPLRGAIPTASASPKPSPSTSTTPRPGNGTDNGGGGGGTAPAPGASGPEGAVVTLTNKERAKAGCGALRTDSHLALAARRHSADMAKHNYLDHTSRNGDSPWKRMEDAGYTGGGGAENIARGYSSAEAVVAGWMKSPGHRANILNCKLRAIGVGMANGSGGPWWTQNFGWK
ncbi:CAP domain-containing protein [Actinomadura hibisca]|uniref:CAP domain-containing protein n=1 Tax=Actinomadura hibisca TaxID=68565 RepID=UPI00082C7906|nr:CAP domain-containing protein [Actinomadura hibisca]